LNTVYWIYGIISLISLFSCFSVDTKSLYVACVKDGFMSPLFQPEPYVTCV